MTFKEIIKNLSDLPQEKQQGIFNLVKSRCGGDIRKITPADLDAARAELTGENTQDASGTVSDSPTDTPRSLDEEMEDIYRLCARGLDEYMQQLGIEDWKKETLTRWRGACEYIGRTVFKNTPLLKDLDFRGEAGNGGSSNFNRYDYDKLSKLLDYYAELCHRHGKPLMEAHFCDFCGLGFGNFDAYERILTPSSMEVFKKAHTQEGADIGDRAIQAGGVTLLAYANRFHGWDGSRQAVKEDKISQLSVDSLPRLGGGGA